jgi:hypothetical protein
MDANAQRFIGDNSRSFAVVIIRPAPPLLSNFYFIAFSQRFWMRLRALQPIAPKLKRGPRPG